MIETLRNSNVAMNMVSAALIAGGVWLGFISGVKLNPTWQGKLRQALGTVAVMGGLLILMLRSNQHVIWEEYSDARVEAARIAGQPVIIDFFAEWCFPCHQLDEFTYSDGRVTRALEPFKKLKLDATDMADESVQSITDRFSVRGLPTVLFLDRSGTEIPRSRLEGFIDAEQMLQHVEALQLGETPP